MLASGARIRSSVLRVFQRSGLSHWMDRRDTTSTAAPASWSSAAYSIALCPPPITTTSRPLKRPKSRWSEECENSFAGSLVNGSGRSEQHAVRHMLAPHLQRPTEDGDSQSSTEEMRRGGQAVGTRADHHNVKDRAHAPFFLMRDANPLMAPRVKVVAALTAGRGSLQDR